ncbi:MAG: hypothetical protein F4X54_07550 [Chloroflexi bacterium]|nr:hypothetical protein [Chloroflexota bacterium]MYB84572.1 hypothetical protein [Chloroflexota bacterium]
MMTPLQVWTEFTAAMELAELTNKDRVDGARVWMTLGGMLAAVLYVQPYLPLGPETTVLAVAGLTAVMSVAATVAWHVSGWLLNPLLRPKEEP